MKNMKLPKYQIGFILLCLIAIVNLISILLWFRTPASTAALRDVTMAVSSLALVVIALVGLQTWKKKEGRQLARRLWLAARKLTEAATLSYAFGLPDIKELLSLLREAAQSGSLPSTAVLKEHAAKLGQHASELIQKEQRFQLVGTEAILTWGKDIETKISSFLESPALKLVRVLQDIHLLFIEFTLEKDPAILEKISAKQHDLEKIKKQTSGEDLHFTTLLDELEDALKPHLKL